MVLLEEGFKKALHAHPPIENLKASRLVFKYLTKMIEGLKGKYATQK